MKPTITIPATAEATDEYRLQQSQQSVRREGLTALRLGKHISKVFRRGIALDPERCIMTTPIDGWSPNTNHTPLQKMVHSKVLMEKVNNQFSDKGLAGFIAISDTTAGVSEVINYDENEQIVKPMVEGLEGDRSVRGVGEEREGGTKE